MTEPPCSSHQNDTVPRFPAMRHVGGFQSLIIKSIFSWGPKSQASNHLKGVHGDHLLGMGLQTFYFPLRTFHVFQI